MTDDPVVREWIANEISVRRRAVLTVMDTMPFAYTVGNSQHNLPELVVFGLADASAARGLLNMLSIQLRAKKGKVKDGDVLAERSGKVKFIDADPVAAEPFTPWLRAYYPVIWTPRIMQVLLCDPAGKFPPNCADPYSRVPLLKKADAAIL